MSINPMRDLVYDFATNTRYIRDDTGEELHPKKNYKEVFFQIKDKSPYPVTITNRNGSRFRISTRVLKYWDYNVTTGYFTAKPEITLSKISLDALNSV